MPGYKHTTTGTNTCKFITKQQLPLGIKPTYVRIVTAFCKQKEDPYQVRMTVRSNLINYMGDVATKSANLTMVKILLNKTISDPRQQAAAIDIKDFYLNNNLPTKEFIRIPVKIIPREIYKQCNLHLFEQDRYLLADALVLGSLCILWVLCQEIGFQHLELQTGPIELPE